ncbi:hypothetical protein GCM10022379_59300 [Micromonospora maritima]
MATVGPGRRAARWTRKDAHEVVTGCSAARQGHPRREGRGAGAVRGAGSGSAASTEPWLSGADGGPGHDWEDRYLAQRSPPAVGGARNAGADRPADAIIVHPGRAGRALGRPARTAPAERWMVAGRASR